MECFLDQTVQGILKVDTAIKHFATVGAVKLGDVQLRVWTEDLLERILAILHLTAIQFYAEETGKRVKEITEMGDG